jgi:hypothetical protein
MKDVKSFLNSRVGYLPTGSSWPTVLNVCYGFHFVCLAPGGKYVCDCKAYWSSRECAHVLAAKHLDDALDIKALMARIDRGRLPGRPRNYVPLGYAAHKPAITARGEIKAANYIGVPVARYLNGDRNKIYCGKIVGKINHSYLVGCNT